MVSNRARRVSNPSFSKVSLVLVSFSWARRSTTEVRKRVLDRVDPRNPFLYHCASCHCRHLSLVLPPPCSGVHEGAWLFRRCVNVIGNADYRHWRSSLRQLYASYHPYVHYNLSDRFRRRYVDLLVQLLTSAYTIFIAENLQAFIMAVTGCKHLISTQVLIFAQLLLFLPLAMIRNLAKLTGTALVADAFILIGRE